MSDILTFQPGVSLAEGRYLLRSSVQPGRWSVTIHGIRATDLAAVIIKTPIAPQGQSRFQSAWMRRTFQALGGFNHPSRNRILDWFEQDGRPFLVMQKVKGPSLEQQLRQGPLSEAVALQLIRQIASGLAGIHSQGLLHRDIQPKNIILRQGVGIPTLVDWGLQRAHCPADKLTPFSAPEQLQGGDIFKHRLDIYGLAATLYAAITGQAPVHPAERQYQLPNPSPNDLAGLIPPRQLQPDLSPVTERAILQGMALNPAQRPATLENWLQLFPLSHSPGVVAQGRSPHPSVGKSKEQRGTTVNRPVTGSSNPGQVWVTQPPPSQVSARQAPATTSPAFSSGRSGSTPPHPASRPGKSAPPVTPALPKRPSASKPPGTNYVLRDAGATRQLGSAENLLRDRQGTSNPKIISPAPSSARPQAHRSRTGTVSPSHPSKNRSAPSEGFLQTTDKAEAMVGATQQSKISSVSVPFQPMKRLTSISILMASIGLAGGLLLRVLNPGSVAGFSGLGRAQDFPETDWPGETQLDELPGDVPQPEYSSGSREALREALPEVLLEQSSEPDRFAAPSVTIAEPTRPLEEPIVQDYSDALQQFPDGENEDNSDWVNPSYPDEYSDSYPESEEGIAVEEGNYADAAPESFPSEEGWSEEGWSEESLSEESWEEDAAETWQEPPAITADDFPEPDLPPIYEDPIPQGTNLPPAEEDVLYEDV